MDNMKKEELLREVGAIKEHLTNLVAVRLDRIRDAIISGEDIDSGFDGDYETVWPLSTMPELFKGRKAAALLFGEERVPVKNWREVYTLVLRRCDADAACHETLMGLRNRIHGRSRTVLSDSPEGMDRPAEICAGMYAEADFDTGALMRMLTIGILDPVGYDYSGISIVLR